MPQYNYPLSKRLVRIIVASIFISVVGTDIGAAASWREQFIERKPDRFPVGNQAAGAQNCVGWACRGALLGEPVHPSGRRMPSASAIHSGAMGFISSANHPMRLEHAAKALREMGVVDEYTILDTPYEIWEWLRHRGPVAASIYWDELMSVHCGSLREIPVTSTSWERREAHAITILGWSPSEKAFYFTPNLGTEWGNRGFAFLREADFPHIFVNAIGFVHENVSDTAMPGPEARERDTYVPYRYSAPVGSDPAGARARLLEEALKAASEAEKAVARPADVGAAHVTVAPRAVVRSSTDASDEAAVAKGDDEPHPRAQPRRTPSSPGGLARSGAGKRYSRSGSEDATGFTLSFDGLNWMKPKVQSRDADRRARFKGIR